jgi:hypothetical protein
MLNSEISGRLCRDENCDRLELHLKHKISKIAKERDPSKSRREPWRRSSPAALDHSIEQAISGAYPKAYEAVLRDVEYDYGSCCSRTVQRHLRRLVERGNILKIDLGRRLYAYVRPDSKLATYDVSFIREQVTG